MYFKISSAICFNLDHSEILTSGNGLRESADSSSSTWLCLPADDILCPAAELFDRRNCWKQVIAIQKCALLLASLSFNPLTDRLFKLSGKERYDVRSIDKWRSNYLIE